MTTHNKITNSIFDLIGNTPLIKLHHITKNLKGTYLAKYEAFNPGHSSKDRIALHIIENAEKRGILKHGDTIVETSSGNTGFSLAMISAIKGYKCIVAVSNKSSFDKIDMLKSMGADVYICPSHVAADHPHSYYEVAKRIQRETPNSIYINQYFNELNIEAHYATTGPEIWEQTQGKVTHVVIASGTGGTISGTGKFLKEQNPNIKVLGVDAYGSILKKYHETRIFDEKEIYPNKIEGLGKNLVPGATDFDVIDKFEKVTDIDAAYKSRQLAKKEGLFTGYTSGAVLQATEQYNAQGYFNKDSVIVLILPDHGSRYMNKIYSDRWMRENGLEDPDRRSLNEVHYIK